MSLASSLTSNSLCFLVENSKEAPKPSIKIGNRDFLNSIIHELKTPLNAIIGFSEILKEDVNNPSSKEECLDYIKEINNAANDLNELVGDLLNSSNQSFSIDLKQKVAIDDIIKRSIRVNSNYALRRKILIKSTIDDELLQNCDQVKLDSKRMRQILSNLISNSIKYSPKNSEIQISAKIIQPSTQTNKQLEITVSDQGFGMTNSQIQTAFEKYKTINNPNSKTVDSFGLGLPITKELVEAQRGTIKIKSQLNKGTEMILLFPFSKLGDTQ